MKARQSSVVVSLLLLTVLILGGCRGSTNEPAAALLGYNADCYNEQGTGEIVCESADDITVAGQYPVLNASSGQKHISGMTSGLIQSATVVPTAYAITTVTAYGCGPRAPAFGGAWDCRASLGASNQITITLIEVDSTPVPTATYQKAVWWIEGN